MALPVFKTGCSPRERRGWVRLPGASANKVIDIVLVGGGHSHIEVLRRFAMEPLPDVRLTLISRGVDTPYSGMLPGLIAGHYRYDDAHIDLHRLARFAGARAYFDEVVGLDPTGRLVYCRQRPPVPYDVASINIGSTPNVSVPGAAEHAVPVKPIDRFLDHWQAMKRRLAGKSGCRIAVVGGGAGGVELLLSAQHALGNHEFHLFTTDATVLPTHSTRVRRKFERILAQRGVHVYTSSRVVNVTPGCLQTGTGTHPVDEILWTTQARAASWIRESGLETDADGFVQVSDSLQSTSHPDVFAAGDVAAIVGYRLEKSGVYAVREGRILAENLRRVALKRALERYRPQRRFLSLISTGNRYAVASRGPLALEGAWVWRWKHRIDRRFMRMYQELPSMEGSRRSAPGFGSRRAPTPEPRAASPEPRAPSLPNAMRCGGCGAKVGSDVLSRALARVQSLHREDVLIGLDAPDDAAVVEVPACKVLVQSVDFFRAMLDDPYVFGKVAANHALGDLYAMGAEPHSALAVVSVPYGPENKVEDTLTQLMSGAVEVLHAAGAALIGGHTGEAAELGLGFTVNGLADRDRILRKSGLRPGDRLILTKPIGTGTLFAAHMRHQARGKWIEGAVASMLQSNRHAALCVAQHGATACTDVTGFGLLGHLYEMAQASGVGVQIDPAAVPVLDGAEETTGAGIFSTLHPENVRTRRVVAGGDEVAATPRGALLFDPQTAGGLLAGVPPDAADSCVKALRAAGYARAAIVGTVIDRPAGPECIVPAR